MKQVGCEARMVKIWSDRVDMCLVLMFIVVNFLTVSDRVSDNQVEQIHRT